jgi:hypothetical protein
MSMKIFALIAMLLFACVTTLAPARSDAPVLGAGDGSFPTLAPFLKRIAPAVVNISVTAEGEGAADFADDPLMPFLFDWPNASALGDGGGVRCDHRRPGGLIVTDRHLVAGAGGSCDPRISGRSAVLTGSDSASTCIAEIGADHLVALLETQTGGGGRLCRRDWQSIRAWTDRLSRHLVAPSALRSLDQRL